MTISNQGSTLTVTDDLTSEKARLHLILYGDEDLYNFNITETTSTFTLNIDGWFIVDSYIFNTYTDIASERGYYVLKSNNVYYLYKDTTLCSVKNVYEDIRNNFEGDDSTNVFMLCNIENCLGSLNLTILDKYQAPCSNCTTIDTQQADIVYMAYSTLQYMAKRGHFAEAQRLLERINKCGYLCGQTNCPDSTPCNCN